MKDSQSGDVFKASMKICFIIHNMTGRAGQERAQANLANALASRGDSISIWSCFRTMPSPCFPLCEGVKVSYGCRNPLPYFVQYPWLICLFAIHVLRFRPRWIVCTDTNVLIVALLAIFVPGVRLVAWEHFALSHSTTKARGRLVRRLAAVLALNIVTLTERDAETYAKLFSPSGEVQAIPNIVALPALNKVSRRQEVLALGRIVPQKGFDLLLEAWATASKRLGGWTLRIVGDGQLRDDLMQLSVRLGVEQTVIFAPFSENPFLLYSECGIFVLSSRFEGLPFVLVEAMMCGAPCISFDCPNGPRELIKNGVNGVLVPPESVAALASAIVELGENAGVRQKLGEAARGISEQFSEDHVVECWQKILLDQH